MKKIIILDDEPNFLEPILEKIEAQLGRDAYVYFAYPEDFFTALNRGEFKDAGCVILDMLFEISDEVNISSPIAGISIAKEFRQLGNNTPIAFYTVINNLEVINECKMIEGVEYISKADRQGLTKLFKFIEKHV